MSQIQLTDGTWYTLRADGRGPVCQSCGYQATTHDRGPVDAHLLSTGNECSLCREDRIDNAKAPGATA